MTKPINSNIEKEYRDSIALASTHYENFPVVSFFVPKRLRKHVGVVYRFARQADDMADEGILSDKDRLILLNKYENDLHLTLSGKPPDAFWDSLGNTIFEMKLTPKFFFDLLKAFRQDVVKKRYDSFSDLLNYCIHSANPVGRIMLELYEIRDQNLLEFSDNICTALQLTNFYQDISVDYQKGRIYIPKDEMERFDVTEKDFELKRNNANFKALLKFQINRTKELFLRGRSLLKALPVPLRNEIKWTILGGELMLNKIESFDYNMLTFRPKLNKFEFIFIVIKSFI